jgi:hypothetical protein
LPETDSSASHSIEHCQLRDCGVGLYVQVFSCLSSGFEGLGLKTISGIRRRPNIGSRNLPPAGEKLLRTVVCFEAHASGLAMNGMLPNILTKLLGLYPSKARFEMDVKYAINFFPVKDFDFFVHSIPTLEYLREKLDRNLEELSNL